MVSTVNIRGCAFTSVANRDSRNGQSRNVSLGTRILNPIYLVDYVIESQGKDKNEDYITESIHIKCTSNSCKCTHVNVIM